jgi:hypothetical protein
MGRINRVCNATASEPLIREIGCTGDKHDGLVVVFAQKEGAVGPFIGKMYFSFAPWNRCPKNAAA